MKENQERHAPPEKGGAGPKNEDDERVAGFLRGLKKREAVEKEEIARRLAEVGEGLEKAFAEAAGELDRSRQRLEGAFDLAAGVPPCKKADLEKVAGELDGILVFTVRKVRPALEREFKTFNPKKKVVLSLLERVNRVRQEEAATLPAQILRRRGALLPAKRIPLQELAMNLATTGEALAQHPLVRTYAELYQGAEARLASLWRGVRFHIEVAAEDLESCPQPPEGEGDEGEVFGSCLDGARVLSLSALEKARDTLLSAGEPLREFLLTIPSSMEEESERLHEKLAREISRAGFLRTRVLRLGHWIAGRGGRIRQSFHDLFDQGRREGERSAGVIRSLVAALGERLRPVFGREVLAEQTLLQLTDLPSTTEVLENARELPPLYQRLYTLGPLKNREFLVAREEELATFEELYQRWEEGRACSVAVIGPEGSGKTSLVNSFESEFGFESAIRRETIGVRLQGENDVLLLFSRWFRPETPFADLDEVVEVIRSRPREILIVEQGHNLLLRTIGARQAVEAFLYVMMATRRHLLWVVTFRKYVWQRLDYLLKLSRYFTHQVPTLFHSEETIRDAILLRQATSGFPLTFLGREDEGGAGSPPDQKTLESRFFRDLFAACAGNIEAAIFYWLLSSRYDAEGESVTIHPLGKLGVGALRDLDRSYLLALAEVVSHGGLSPEEHGAIFRCTPLESRLVLGYLAQLNLLVPQGKNDRGLPAHYAFNPIFFGPVTATLESMNILY